MKTRYLCFLNLLLFIFQHRFCIFYLFLFQLKYHLKQIPHCYNNLKYIIIKANSVDVEQTIKNTQLCCLLVVSNCIYLRIAYLPSSFFRFDTKESMSIFRRAVYVSKSSIVCYILSNKTNLMNWMVV